MRGVVVDAPRQHRPLNAGVLVGQRQQSFLPLEFWLGTKPTQTLNWRALLNWRMSPTAVTKAEAVRSLTPCNCTVRAEA